MMRCLYARVKATRREFTGVILTEHINNLMLKRCGIVFLANVQVGVVDSEGVLNFENFAYITIQKMI